MNGVIVEAYDIGGCANATKNKIEGELHHTVEKNRNLYIIIFLLLFRERQVYRDW